MSLCVDLCTPSGTVGGVSFAAGVDFVVRLLWCRFLPCNFFLWVCRSFLLREARYRGYFILRGVAMCKLVLVARWLGEVVFRYTLYTWCVWLYWCISVRFGPIRGSVRCAVRGYGLVQWFGPVLSRSWWWLVLVLVGFVLFGVSILIAGVCMSIVQLSAAVSVGKGKQNIHFCVLIGFLFLGIHDCGCSCWFSWWRFIQL